MAKDKDPDAPVKIHALNADKTAIVDADSPEAAWLVRDDELDDHLVKPAKRTKADAADNGGSTE